MIVPRGVLATPCVVFDSSILTGIEICQDMRFKVEDVKVCVPKLLISEIVRKCQV